MQDGCTPLHLAVQQGHYEGAELLLGELQQAFPGDMQGLGRLLHRPNQVRCVLAAP